MKKILFDASVHFGQFSLGSEVARLGCKDSQASISDTLDEDIVGIVTFNENSWADHVVWDLDRDTQDIFYRFMDVFHSQKNIERVPLVAEDVAAALELRKRFHLDISRALSCAVAIRTGAQEIHTLHEDLLAPAIVDFLREHHSITVRAPVASKEKTYSEELEQCYQAALTRFRSQKIDLRPRLNR